MTVWIKQGVLGDLSPNMRRAKGKLINLYYMKGLDFYITSVREGNHCNGSCHYEGDAVDIKRQGIKKTELVVLLGKDFDIIEYDKLDIFHIEYDPKGV